MQSLEGVNPREEKARDDPTIQKWICRQCSILYDSVTGAPDSGIAPGTAFADIPEDWHCPICGATKKHSFPMSKLLLLKDDFTQSGRGFPAPNVLLQAFPTPLVLTN